MSKCFKSFIEMMSFFIIRVFYTVSFPGDWQLCMFELLLTALYFLWSINWGDLAVIKFTIIAHLNKYHSPTPKHQFSFRTDLRKVLTSVRKYVQFFGSLSPASTLLLLTSRLCLGRPEQADELPEAMARISYCPTVQSARQCGLTALGHWSLSKLKTGPVRRHCG